MSLLRVLLLCLFCAPVAIVATSHTVSPGDDWTGLLTGLQPGDSVVFNPLTPGTPYIYNFSHSNAWTLNGAANNPITIEGAVGESVTLNQLSDQYNCMDVVGSYFVIQNLALTSNISGVVGLSLKANVSNAVFDSLTVHDVLENAIKANTPGAVYDNVTFTNCEVYNTGRTGECFYLGCQPSGTPTDAIECVFKNGLIENNYCHDTCVSTDGCNGAGSDGSGFQLKGWGSYGNVLRRNVCKNVNSVCMLLYDDFDLGANIVEENWIYGSVIDAGIQVSAGAIIRNNIIYDNVVGIAVTSNSNNLEPTKSNRNIIIEGNTIIDNGSIGIDLPDAFSPTTGTRIQNNLVIQNSGNAFEGGDQSDILWLNNYFFGGSALVGVNSTGAIQLGSTSGVIVDATSFDFHPVSGSPVLAAGAALDPTDAAYDFDFNARSCSDPSVGAYESVGSGALSFGILPAPSGSESPCGAFGESACSACSVVETTTGTTDSTTTGSTDTTTTGSTDTTTTGSTDTTTTGTTDTTTTGSTDTTTTGSTDTTTTGTTDTTTTGSTDTTTTGTTDSTTTGTTDSTTTGTTDSTTTGTTDSTTTGTTDSTTTGATTSSSTRAATTRTTTATTRTTTTISGTTTQEGTETSTLTTTTVGDDFTSGAKTARVCLALLVAFCLTLLF